MGKKNRWDQASGARRPEGNSINTLAGGGTNRLSHAPQVSPVIPYHVSTVDSAVAGQSGMLLSCPECKGDVSAAALACPRCGLLVSKWRRNGLPSIPPDTRILRSDPHAADKWEDIRLRLRRAEAAERHSEAILRAVAQAEEKQAELLEVLRDRAWQLFSAAGCPRCRAHEAKQLTSWDRAKFFGRGRWLAAFLGKKYCAACRHVWS